jgi:4-diphosphocytidyl-2-C-methyl-D-erythritol kinase
MLTLLAPAKVNLTLEVLAKRPDGYHELRSVVQTVSLCDKLHFEVGAEDKIEIHCADPGWALELSLVSKAVSLLREAAGCSKGVRLTLEKNIPLLAGLGGESSAAAAVLIGLNRLWGSGLPREELLDLAARLGSDVSFFLYGGTARLGGRGEVVTPLSPPAKTWLVLLLPPLSRRPGKTGRLYGALGLEHFTDGRITERLADRLSHGREIEPDLLFNVFDGVAGECFTGLDSYRAQFIRAGVGTVHLAGSGPGLYALTKDKTAAEKLCQALKRQNMEAYLVQTLDVVDYMKCPVL